MRLLQIFTKEEKIKFIWLSLVILMMGFLEVVGVASILPFMQLMAEPNAITQNRWLSAAYDLFHFVSLKQMLIYSGVTIIILIGITNVFSIFATWLQYKYSWNIAHNLGMRLLSSYLGKPYKFYLKNNTSELQTYIISEVGSLTGGVIVPIIEIFSRSFVAIIILILLFMVDPNIALVMFGGLGSAYVLIYMSQKNYLKKIGKHRIEMNLLRYKTLKEAFEGIKTIMVYNKRDFFFQRYEYASREFSNIQPVYNLLLAIPRSALEFLAFGSILGVTIYLYISAGDIQSALPRLSLYAVAGYRLLPALQKIFAALAKLRHNLPIVDKVYKDLALNHQQAQIDPIASDFEMPAVPFKNKIELDFLQFRYEAEQEPIIDNLDITIKKGQTIAFIGSTGSGKTTLIDLVVGLLHPTSGGIKIDGLQLNPDNVKAWQQQIAYVPQEVFLFDNTISRNITLGIDEKDIDIKQLERATQLADIYQFISETLPDGFETNIGDRGVRISGGQRQRLGLARALYTLPSVLVLDEATSALDSITEKSVIESLKTLPQDITTIIIAHRLSTVKHADCIYILDKGKVAAKGSYEMLVESSDTFKTMVKLS